VHAPYHAAWHEPLLVVLLACANIGLCKRLRRKANAPSITEQARRAQIITTAIQMIAEVGYPKASSLAMQVVTGIYYARTGVWSRIGLPWPPSPAPKLK
jgi:hypothetical protein